MPKRKAPKEINQAIMKAMQTLTNQNPYAVVSLGSIVQEVNNQLKKIPMIGNFDKTIKEAIYKIRDLGLIGHVGFNQYCCADCFAKVECEPPEPRMPSNIKAIDPKYFREPIFVNVIRKTRKRSHEEFFQKPMPNLPVLGAHQAPPRIMENSDEVAAKKRRFERYLKGEFNSEEDSDGNNQGVVIEEIPVEVWQDYEASLLKSRAQMKHSDEKDDNVAASTEFEKVAQNENVEITAEDTETNRLEGAKHDIKLKVNPEENEPKL